MIGRTAGAAGRPARRAAARAAGGSPTGPAATSPGPGLAAAGPGPARRGRPTGTPGRSRCRRRARGPSPPASTCRGGERAARPRRVPRPGRLARRGAARARRRGAAGWCPGADGAAPARRAVAARRAGRARADGERVRHGCARSRSRSSSTAIADRARGRRAPARVATVVHCCADRPAGRGARPHRRGRAVARRRPPGARGVGGGRRTPSRAASALWAGVVPTSGALPATGAVADAVWTPWRALGLDAGRLASVVLTPACGLAAIDPTDARARLARVHEPRRRSPNGPRTPPERGSRHRSLRGRRRPTMDGCRVAFPPAPPLMPFVAGYQGYRLAGLPAGAARRPAVAVPHADRHAGRAARSSPRTPTPRRPAAVTTPSSAGSTPGPRSSRTRAPSPASRSRSTRCGARALLGVPAGELAELDVDADAVLGRLADDAARADARAPSPGRERFGVLDAALLGRLRATPAAAAARGRARLATAAGVAGRRPRRDPRARRSAGAPGTWAPCSAREIGLSPKAAARVVRFDRARRLLAGTPARVAHVAAARAGTPTSRTSTATSGEFAGAPRADGWPRRSETSKSRRRRQPGSRRLDRHDATNTAAPGLAHAPRDGRPRLIRFLVDGFGFQEADVVRRRRRRRPRRASLAARRRHHARLGARPTPPIAGRSPRHAGAYVVTDDPDALFARAVAAGRAASPEPYDTDYGSREFAVRDPEGNLWSFGTYRGAPA